MDINIEFDCSFQNIVFQNRTFQDWDFHNFSVFLEVAISIFSPQAAQDQANQVPAQDPDPENQRIHQH